MLRGLRRKEFAVSDAKNPVGPGGGIRPARGHFIGKPLDARPAGSQRILFAAFAAPVRPALCMAAVMAHQSPAEAVLDQPGAALPAFVFVPAGAA